MVGEMIADGGLALRLRVTSTGGHDLDFSGHTALRRGGEVSSYFLLQEAGPTLLTVQTERLTSARPHT
jgi:hypothetical protein